MKLVEKDPKIPKHDKVLKDTEADKEKEKTMLDWYPKYSLEAGIRKYINYRNNENE